MRMVLNYALCMTAAMTFIAGGAACGGFGDDDASAETTEAVTGTDVVALARTRDEGHVASLGETVLTKMPAPTKTSSRSHS